MYVTGLLSPSPILISSHQDGKHGVIKIWSVSLLETKRICWLICRSWVDEWGGHTYHMLPPCLRWYTYIFYMWKQPILLYSVHCLMTRTRRYTSISWRAIIPFHVPPQDVMEEYRRTGRHTKHGMELVVEMLTTGYWPTQSSPKCRLPPQAVRCCDDFVEFYLQKHTVSW